MQRRAFGIAVVVTMAVGVLSSSAHAAILPPATIQALERSPYVYIATERKNGGFGTAAEIWFMWHDGAVWMASPPTTWRAKRIKAGRTSARIAVGTKDGPSFTATGSFVRDPAAYERLFATYAKKYPDGWRRYETSFRDGLKNGSRVLMRYEPVTEAAAGAAPRASATASAPAPPRPSVSSRP